MPKWEPPLPPPVTEGLIAGAITRYLEQPHKTSDKAVLDDMVTAFRRTILRQVMSPRQDRTGYESTTTYTHPCTRKAHFALTGAAREPLRARALLKFLLGDMVELTVLGVAKLAGLDIGLNNEDLTIEGRDSKLIPVHPDGLLHWENRWYNVEIKSCDSRTFDRWLEQGGPSDEWGYRTQASVEVQAWRETRLEVNETCFVAVSTGSRQGSIAEWRLPFQSELVEAWHDRRDAARGDTPPPINYPSMPEMTFVRGKELDAALLSHGEPMARLDKAGKTYGWDVPTGRELIPAVPCAYCDFVKACWAGATLDIQDGKPVWVIPSAAQAGLLDELRAALVAQPDPAALDAWWTEHSGDILRLSTTDRDALGQAYWARLKALQGRLV